jgi:uncharacterized protein YndB with AHSA1/START domain
MTTTETTGTTQVYRVYIKAAREAVWDAVPRPDWNSRYGDGSPSEYDLRPGGAFRGLASQAMREHGGPEVILDGEILESDPPRRLVQTWHAVFDPEIAAEPATRLTSDLEPQEAGVTLVTITHDLDGAPKTAAQVGGQVPGAGGGGSYILGDLETLLETGAALGSARTGPAVAKPRHPADDGYMDVTAGGGPHPPFAGTGEEIVSACCWSCGGAVYKVVRRPPRGHVAWTCDTCDVAWSGPGTPLPRTA